MRKLAAALFLVCMMSTLPLASYAQFKVDAPVWNHRISRAHPIKHVLLISVDGLHALDLANYVAAHSGSTLAYLSSHGVTYTNNTTSQPSDSFPGLSALVTGGSPITSGLWYDVAYNRTFAPPAQSNQYIAEVGIPGGPCTPGAATGAPTEYDEAIDVDLTQLPLGGGTNPINPNFLPRDSNCNPVYPHQYVKVNTVFEVVKANGGRTAWTDKHPSYEWTNGPSGAGVDDFYGPEINSTPVAIPASMLSSIPATPPFVTCDPVNFVDSAPDDGWTTDLNNIKCYDSTHVQAVLNEIDGWNHNHTSFVGVPTLFGANFQAVSIGQKLNGCPSTDYPSCSTQNGYTDVLGTPSAGLEGELDFVDASLGLMVAELKKEGLWDSTLIIVGAKHGQSPIDITRRVGIGGGQPATTLGSLEAFDISDDGSLIWLADQSQTGTAVATLATPANQAALGIQEIFALNSLKDKWDDPTVDPRTPDIILKTNTGVIFTGGHKLAEHGGLNEDDLHVALLVAGADVPAKSVHYAVSNQQVAPTILKALGIDPFELKAVQKEKVPVLPDLF